MESNLLPQNLTVIRKQVRGPSRQKTGRKRPRPGDKNGDVKPKQANIETDQNYTEADGSEQNAGIEHKDGLEQTMEQERRRYSSTPYVKSVTKWSFIFAK